MRALIVDGYNAIHAWPRLQALASRARLGDARAKLIGLLSEYSAATGVDITVVFDSHNVTGAEQIERTDGITVRYGTAAASADHVIERLAYKATRRGIDHEVIVATTDRLQRDLVIAMGVGVMTTLELATEVDRALAATKEQAEGRARQAELSNRVEDHLDPQVRERLEKLRRGGDADERSPE